MHIFRFPRNYLAPFDQPSWICSECQQAIHTDFPMVEFRQARLYQLVCMDCLRLALRSCEEAAETITPRHKRALRGQY